MPDRAGITCSTELQGVLTKAMSPRALTVTPSMPPNSAASGAPPLPENNWPSPATV